MDTKQSEKNINQDREFLYDFNSTTEPYLKNNKHKKFWLDTINFFNIKINTLKFLLGFFSALFISDFISKSIGKFLKIQDPLCMILSYAAIVVLSILGIAKLRKQKYVFIGALFIIGMFLLEGLIAGVILYFSQNTKTMPEIFNLNKTVENTLQDQQQPEPVGIDSKITRTNTNPTAAANNNVLSEKGYAQQAYLDKLIKSGSDNWSVRRSDKLGYEIKLPADWEGKDYSYYNYHFDDGHQINISMEYVENFDLFLQEMAQRSKKSNFKIESNKNDEINGQSVSIIETSDENGHDLYYYFKVPTTIHQQSQKYRYNAIRIYFGGFVYGWKFDKQERDFISLLISTFKILKTAETETDKQWNELATASVCILQPYLQENIRLTDGEADYTYNFENDVVNYNASMDNDKFLISDIDNDGNNEAIIFVTEFETLSHIYPLYMEVLKNDKGQWICQGKQNTILMGSSELSINSITVDKGLIKINRDADFDRYNMTSKTIEETYKFENGNLKLIQEKVIQTNEPKG